MVRKRRDMDDLKVTGERLRPAHMVEGSRESLFGMKGPMLIEQEEEMNERQSICPSQLGRGPPRVQGGMDFLRLAPALKEGDGEEACRCGRTGEERIMTYEGRPSPANSGNVGTGEALGSKRVAINIRHGIRGQKAKCTEQEGGPNETNDTQRQQIG